MKKRVLVIAAHPDDEVLGVGGTIACHRRHGNEVTVVFVADGVTSHHDQTEPQKVAARRACGILGVEDVRFLDLPDQRLDGLPLLDVIKPIDAVVKALRPHIIYTHHRGDANQDHRTVFDATLVSARPFGDNSVEQLYSYEVGSSTEWGPPFGGWAFTPNVYVDIASVLHLKLAALEAYRDTFRSEIMPFPHPRSPEAVTVYAQQRGVNVGMESAEAFMLIRQLIR